MSLRWLASDEMGCCGCGRVVVCENGNTDVGGLLVGKGVGEGVVVMRRIVLLSKRKDFLTSGIKKKW